MSNDKKKSLGIGLEGMFGSNLKDVISDSNIKKHFIEEIDVSKILKSPNNPRKHFSSKKIEELANSLKEHGLLSPIILRKKDDHYVIVAGERRFRAAELLNWKTIKSIVIEADEEKVSKLAIIENIQRENINPVEEAIAINKLIELKNQSHDEIAKALGKSRVYVTNKLRLLKLDSHILDIVAHNKLSYGHVRPLITLEKHIADEVSNKAIENKWSVRQVESYVSQYLPKNKYAIKDKDLAKSIHDHFTTDKIDAVLKSDKLVFKYKNKEELEKILVKLGIKK